MRRMTVRLPDTNVTLVRNVCEICAYGLLRRPRWTFTFRGKEYSTSIRFVRTTPGLELCHICPRPHE